MFSFVIFCNKSDNIAQLVTFCMPDYLDSKTSPMLACLIFFYFFCLLTLKHCTQSSPSMTKEGFKDVSSIKKIKEEWVSKSPYYVSVVWLHFKTSFISTWHFSSLFLPPHFLSLVNFLPVCAIHTVFHFFGPFDLSLLSASSLWLHSAASSHAGRSVTFGDNWVVALIDGDWGHFRMTFLTDGTVMCLLRFASLSLRLAVNTLW